MKTFPDDAPLLDAVLAESAPPQDTVEPLLRAVRWRRRRRHALQAAAVTNLAAILVFGSWLAWRQPVPGPGDLSLDAPVAVLVRPHPRPGVQRIHSTTLSRLDRVTTRDHSESVARVQSRPERGLRATDGELLALAGGRGVGLFRSDGHASLLVASSP